MARDNPLSADSVNDLAALATLLEEHRPKLRAMIQRRIDPSLAARIDADDILAEGFLQAQRKWDRFQQSGMTAYAWLYRIALDCLIEAWRRETRDRRNPDREMPWPDRSSVQLGLNLIGTGTTPSSAAARKELQARMRQALETLKPADREILWMRHYDELSFKEAAAVLGITENAANVRYVRALNRLKDLWTSRR